MKHITLMAAAMSLVALPTFAADNDTSSRAAQDRISRTERREARKDFEQLVKDINALDDQPAARRAGATEAALQSGLPEARFAVPPKGQVGANLGSQFLAQEIAKNTGKTPQQILKARTDGDSWTQIVQANKQDMATLERKLSRIHEAMLNPNSKAVASANRDLKTRPAPAAVDSPLDKTIQTVNSLGQEQEARRLGLEAIARETRLSRREVEQAAEQNKQMGIGDFFVAQELALQSKKSVNEIWNLHLSPKSWADIAQSNNSSESQLERQLARIEDAMRGRAVRNDDTERVRARDQRRDGASPKATYDEAAFEKSVQAVNSLGQNADIQRVGLRAIARETAMSMSQVEQAHQQNQKLGMGDLFVAQELATKSRKSVDEIWRQHLSPKTWAEVAKDNNQDIGEIQRKLARVEQALRDAGK